MRLRHRPVISSLQAEVAHSERRVDVDPAPHLEQAETHFAHAVVEFVMRKVHRLVIQKRRVSLAYRPLAHRPLLPGKADRGDVVQRRGVLELLRWDAN